MVADLLLVPPQSWVTDLRERKGGVGMKIDCTPALHCAHKSIGTLKTYNLLYSPTVMLHVQGHKRILFS